MMQSLMGAAIFRWQSLPNDNRKAWRGQRFQISVLSFPLNSTPLHSTHDRLLLLKRPHEFCTKSSKQFACRAQFHARNGSSRLLVDLRLGAILTRQLDYCYFYRSNLTTFSLLPFLQHIIFIFILKGFFSTRNETKHDHIHTPCL